MENKDTVGEVKEGEKCTCGDECKCGDDCKCKKSKKKIIFIIIGALLLIGLVLCIYFFVIKDDKKDDNKTDNNIEDKVDKEENKDVENDETKVEQDNEIVEDEDVQDENNDEYEDDSYDEDDDNYDEGDSNYVAEPVKFFGLDGEYKYGELIVKKEYGAESYSLSFSYNLDSDSHLETFSIKRIESDDFEENYQIKYTDKDTNGKEKVFSPVIEDVNGWLIGVDIVDINKNDGKLDVLINFYSDVSGEVVLFNVTTGEIFSFGPVQNTTIYINEEGKIAIPIYYTVFFDLLFATDYYVVGTDGKVTKNKIDLSNINKEVTIPEGEPDFSYCTSSRDCDYDEWKEFPGGAKIKLISYSEQNGLIAEYEGQKVFILAPWG